eukprot:365038-Chlamydomonas_euryale.AAC.12
MESASRQTRPAPMHRVVSSTGRTAAPVQAWPVPLHRVITSRRSRDSTCPGVACAAAYAALRCPRCASTLRGRRSGGGSAVPRLHHARHAASRGSSASAVHNKRATFALAHALAAKGLGFRRPAERPIHASRTQGAVPVVTAAILNVAAVRASSGQGDEPARRRVVAVSAVQAGDVL